jgi:hypothetical protein
MMVTIWSYSMAPISDALAQAAADARYLLSRGYPRERVLRVVGDRWGLNADYRHLLRRGVFAPAEARARKSRLLDLEACHDRVVGVDGHNVLITLETALTGGRLIMADDGVLRDIAGKGSNHRPGPTTHQAAGLMLEKLVAARAASVHVYLDAPLSKSGELAAKLRDMLAAAGLPGDAQAVAAPERMLIKHHGPVATSDSALIDQVAEPIDLAQKIILGFNPVPAWESLTP